MQEVVGAPVAAAQLPDGMRPDADADDFLPGRGEWLFERDGGRRVLAQMRGDVMLARKAALRWLFVLESRVAWLEGRGIPYVFGVAPCKSAVLEQHLPLGTVLFPRRPVAQLLHRIAEDESFAEIVYPLQELRAEPDARPTFSTHDSRWNANGAFVGYRRLLAAMPRSVAARRLARGDVAFDVRELHGDLGPRQLRPAFVGAPQPQTARIVSDNGLAGEGRMLVTSCDTAPPGTCLCFGDWSAYRMLPYLAESFGRMVFVHLRALDHELVEAERPGVVIGLADETGLLDLPADVEAPRAREVASRKLSGGRDAAHEPAEQPREPAGREADKVVEGKEGWLYLTHDTNRVMDQHTGRLRFSERQLEDWRHVLETRHAWLARRDIPYLLFVPPNPHAVYPEYLPDDVVTVAERPVLQLLRHLRERESKARVVYPLDELVAHKQHDPVYIKTDSHWNELGAFIAYKRLMRELSGLVGAREIGWDQLFVSRSEQAGDLGGKLQPQRTSTQIFVDVRGWQAHYALDNRVRVTGRRIEYRCRLAPDVTCLIHGDSFTEKLLHVLAESFGRTVFCQMPSLDFQVVQQVRPDVVIGLQNERFLLDVPYDSTAPTQGELAAVKQAQGKVYGPRTHTATPRVDSFD